jgi:hypothetical protein
MDTKLDYAEESSFVELYRQAVEQVCKGVKAYDAFCEFNGKKEQVLRGVWNLAEDTSLTEEDIVVLVDALTREHGDSPAAKAKIEKILDSREALSEFHSQRLIVVEKYFDASKLIPHEVHSGQMQQAIAQENWGDGAASSAAGG